MRFHMLHNIDTVLNFLRFKRIKLVNIRSEDIVDGNPKLILGLIWTIILHFQVSVYKLCQKPKAHTFNFTQLEPLLRNFSFELLKTFGTYGQITKSKPDQFTLTHKHQNNLHVGFSDLMQ